MALTNLPTTLFTSALQPAIPDQENADYLTDKINEIVFSIFFALSFVLVLGMSIYNFCHFPNMINLPNLLVVILLLITLLSK